jgi:hypothetical protein
MFPFGPVQVQSNPSASFNELRDSFDYVGRRIEQGRRVTVVLTSDGRAIALSVEGEHVEVSDPPAHIPRAGSDYTSLSALMTDVYRFDLNQTQRDISASDVELGIIKKAKTTALPNPLVRKSTAHNWILAEDCSVDVAEGTITVRSGFETDFASIPRLFWPLMDSTELGIVPPTVHDLIYRSGGNVCLPAGEVAPLGTSFSRAQADDVFADLMARSPEVKAWRRWLAYQAVRLCGGSSWRGIA